MAIDNVELTKLTDCLNHCDLGKPLELDLSPTSQLKDVVNVINQIIETRRKSAANTMLELNQVVGQMTGMTSIRELLQRIQEQTPQIANMSEHAQEMSAASSQTASSTSNAASYVEQSLTIASSGVEKIKQAINFVERSFSQFEHVSQQVQAVLDSMSEIEQIVSVIAGVADQTNLLALNAAIEAARAGEQGRGFAVVADEVRKLAEHTTDSVTDIRQKIDHLSQNSSRTANDIQSLSQMMWEGKSVMQVAGQEVEQILNHVVTISGDIQQIAAGSQEQSAVIQEFSKSIGLISNSAQQTEIVAHQTGERVHNISQLLGAIRAHQIQSVPHLTNQEALELCKTDHLLWTWRIYNMLLGYEHVDPSTVDTHHECRLGQWVDGSESATLQENSTFKKLAAPHERVHELARQAALAYNQGKEGEAENLLAQMSQASQEVVQILEELKQIL